MKKAAQRDTRIELLRARAAVERQSVRYNAAVIQNTLTPSGIVRSLFSGGGGRSRSRRSSSANWLLEGVRMVRRYPFLLSAASALVAKVRRRRGRWALSAAAAALLVWQASRSVGASSHSTDTK